MKINEITDDRDHILNLIKKDSKPFLQKIGNKIGTFPIYRGMNTYDPPESIIRRIVRLDDRKPMSSAQIKHDRYNNYFEDKFGAPFRNSLHVTGDPDIAKQYGNMFVIFPIGDFDWVWSPMIPDMALDIRWPNIGGHINIPPSQEAVNDKLDTLDYNINSNFIGAIVSGNEIMIRCKEYYAIRDRVFRHII